MTHAIRCQLDAPHRRAAHALTLSFVHHQCSLVDADVSTTEALEAATTEVVDDLTAGECEVTDISLDPDFPGLDLLIGTRHTSAVSSFCPGVVARATFDEIVIDDERIRLVYRFDGRPAT
ncbi:MAG: hypothetical protein ABIP17_07475 [Ilumatobacteraceae bacterium]